MTHLWAKVRQSVVVFAIFSFWNKSKDSRTYEGLAICCVCSNLFTLQQKATDCQTYNGLALYCFCCNLFISEQKRQILRPTIVRQIVFCFFEKHPDLSQNYPPGGVWRDRFRKINAFDGVELQKIS